MIRSSLERLFKALTLLHRLAKGGNFEGLLAAGVRLHRVGARRMAAACTGLAFKPSQIPFGMMLLLDVSCCKGVLNS